jgi:hypothetical protein
MTANFFMLPSSRKSVQRLIGLSPAFALSYGGDSGEMRSCDQAQNDAMKGYPCEMERAIITGEDGQEATA